MEIEEKLAPGSLVLALSFGNLGLVANERGDLAKAEQYLRQALEIQEKLAPGSLGVAASLDNLGVVANKRGDLAKAESYLTLYADKAKDGFYRPFALRMIQKIRERNS